MPNVIVLGDFTLIANACHMSKFPYNVWLTIRIYIMLYLLLLK